MHFFPRKSCMCGRETHILYSRGVLWARTFDISRGPRKKKRKKTISTGREIDVLYQIYPFIYSSFFVHVHFCDFFRWPLVHFFFCACVFIFTTESKWGVFEHFRVEMWREKILIIILYEVLRWKTAILEVFNFKLVLHLKFKYNFNMKICNLFYEF